MAVFTSNQVNHVYVAKAVAGDSSGVGYELDTNNKAVKPSVSNVGDIFCWKTAENELYFTYKNAEGGIIRSDLIPVKNIMWARAVSGNHRSQKRALKKYEIGISSLAAGDVNKTALTVILEMDLHNGVESVYRKTVTVLVKSSTIANVVDALKEAIDKNFSKDDYVKDLFTISTTGSSNSKKVVITEKSQSAKYKRGIYANEPVNFKVFCSEDDSSYLTITGPTDTSSYIYNGYDIADLEYFALGERGDKYRLVGWPNAAPSKTVADTPTDSSKYNVLQIHFAFTDSNEGVQKSEKDITIAIPVGDASHEADAINQLLSQIAYQILGDDNSGSQGAATGGNTAFALTDTKVNVLDIPSGKKTQLS